MKIHIDEQSVYKQVREFKYLGSLISEDGYCAKEIHSRIALGKKYSWTRKVGSQAS